MSVAVEVGRGPVPVKGSMSPGRCSQGVDSGFGAAVLVTKVPRLPLPLTRPVQGGPASRGDEPDPTWVVAASRGDDGRESERAWHLS